MEVPMNHINDLKSDGKLLSALSRAAATPISAKELFQQRVSFVYGSLDSKSGVTKERIGEIIRGMSGGGEAPK
jgi:hypothetical protein